LHAKLIVCSRPLGQRSGIKQIQRQQQEYFRKQAESEPGSVKRKASHHDLAALQSSDVLKFEALQATSRLSPKGRTPKITESMLPILHCCFNSLMQ
jgi:hypothetical protein